MKYFALLAMGPLLTAGFALADTPGIAATTPAAVPAATPMAAAPAKVVKPGNLSCEQFLLYDDVTRPQIVYWSEGAAHKGKAGGEIIDVERTNTLVPILVDDCTRDPKTSFWHKFKSEFEKTPAAAQSK
jgi:acid stress chaperone HdeA